MGSVSFMPCFSRPRMHQFQLVLHQGVAGGPALFQPQLLSGSAGFLHPDPTLAGWGWVAATADCSGDSLLTLDSFSCRQVEGVPMVSRCLGLATHLLNSDGSGELDGITGLWDGSGGLWEAQVCLFFLFLLLLVFLPFHCFVFFCAAFFLYHICIFFFFFFPN